MAQKQKQKQKQTVIVNIGDKVIKRKRKRRKAPRAPPRGPPAYRGGPPPPPFVQQTIYPTANLAKIDEVQFQLNSVVDQLKNLQDKQLHKTANLMAGRKAEERALEEKMTKEVSEREQTERFYSLLRATEQARDEIARAEGLQGRVIPEARVVGIARASSAPPVLAKPPPEIRGRSRERKQRSDFGKKRGPRKTSGGAAAEPERFVIKVPKKKPKPIEGGGIPPRMFG